MKNAIVKNSSGFLTESAEEWVLWVDGEKETVPKIEQPYYPIALVQKWGFEVVNQERYDNLCRQFQIEHNDDPDYPS